MNTSLLVLWHSISISAGLLAVAGVTLLLPREVLPLLSPRAPLGALLVIAGLTGLGVMNGLSRRPDHDGPPPLTLRVLRLFRYVLEGSWALWIVYGTIWALIGGREAVTWVSVHAFFTGAAVGFVLPDEPALSRRRRLRWAVLSGISLALFAAWSPAPFARTDLLVMTAGVGMIMGAAYIRRECIATFVALWPWPLERDG